MSNLFTKVIAEKQFNFQHFEFGDKTGYHVDVKDENGTRWEFRMLKDAAGWTMEGEKLPAWIPDTEDALFDAIKEHG